jgi:hypothetical protein
MSESQYTTVLEAHRATIEKAIDCFIGAYDYGLLEIHH